ncbi:MAG: oligosaccharide repeat unit polymerase, partial [Bacteroidales bacterium]|nr:oligosaccharide repeat unit polymerase [Bacteroidales bacterium]
MDKQKKIKQLLVNGKVILFCFVSFTVISYAYTLVTGTYNGDFLFYTPRLSGFLLFANFIFTIFPFFVLYGIYKRYKFIDTSSYIRVPKNVFGIFVFFLLAFHLSVTALFGVGSMAGYGYEAPSYIRPAIQIFNRFDYVFGVFIYIIIDGKRSKYHYFMLFVALFVSFLRASLGVMV